MMWILVLAGAIGVPIVTAVVLRRAWVAVVWLGWTAVSALLAANDVYRQSADVLRPWIAVAVVVPFAVAVSATRIPAVARILDEPGMAARLVLPQRFRVIGGVFLIAMLLGDLPPAFALPAGLGDIAVGIAAFFVARRETQTAWFHVFGLLDLVVAVSMGFLAGLGPAQLIPASPSTLAVSVLPLVLIPTTAVPLLAALHVAALTRLRAPVAVG